MSLLFIPCLPTCFPQRIGGSRVGYLSRFVEVAQDSSCGAWGAGLCAHQLLQLGECLQLVRAAVVLLITRRKGRRDGIPFGPFLAIGGYVAFVAGTQLWQLYWGLI